MKKRCWIICLITVLVFFLLAGAAVEPAYAEVRENNAAYSQQSTTSALQRALSLRVLQQKLADRQNSDEIMHLAGLTKITGYVADRDNKDIILLGEVQPGAPPLYLIDFITALRNVFLEYTKKQGRTVYYSPPMCSIDPDPKTLASLNELAGQIFRASANDTESAIASWHTVCRQPQDVVVTGVPFQSHFGGVMVKADYDMKRLVDGADTLDLPGLESLTDMTLNIVRNEMRQGRASSIPASSMNRFWFYPGKNTYLEDKDSVLIEQCQVVLLTEEEYVTSRGSVKGKGRPNPLARKFADSFTQRYAEIAARRGIYAELENLFRFMALAKIIKHREVQNKTGLDFDLLLKQVILPEISLERKVPGRSNVKQFSMQRAVPGGVQMATVLLPSCGGVGIDIEINNKNYIIAPDGMVREIRKRVLSLRPSLQAFFWDLVPTEKTTVANISHRSD